MYAKSFYKHKYSESTDKSEIIFTIVVSKCDPFTECIT